MEKSGTVFWGGKKKFIAMIILRQLLLSPMTTLFSVFLFFFAQAALLYYQRDIVWIFNIRLIVLTATIQVSFDVDFNPHSSLC